MTTPMCHQEMERCLTLEADGTEKESDFAKLLRIALCNYFGGLHEVVRPELKYETQTTRTYTPSK
ncbi:hypothetical protein Poly51_34350 [Rubripirellula tenax]|uniref:Uncharacterized protein n=1 Tax=Rubripirellula tenax TaxID=2528015 RepID=A0A5C6F3Y0_9BACT|nr:hypothetical protein Poly51_34350 [Rubripirellula tenax]